MSTVLGVSLLPILVQHDHQRCVMHREENGPLITRGIEVFMTGPTGNDEHIALFPLEADPVNDRRTFSLEDVVDTAADVSMGLGLHPGTQQLNPAGEGGHDRSPRVRINVLESQAVTQVLNGTVLKYGVGQLRPAWEKRLVEYPPMFTYKWADTERALNNLALVDASPFDDVALEYINPHTGGPVMPSFTCWIQLLRPRMQTQAHRHVGSSIYHVFEGKGATIIDGIRFEWEQGDMFVIPSWACHEHLNASGDERAILFSMHDTPLMVMLNKYREEAYTENGGHQPVEGKHLGR